MNLHPAQRTPQFISLPPPIVILLLPERCSSHRTTETTITEQHIVRSRGTAFSATFEFVYTSNHRHDGINE
jgi:hypothetical protein